MRDVLPPAPRSLLVLALLVPLTAAAEDPRPPDLVQLPSLKTARIPEPSNLSTFVRDRAAAVRLGKAFFWEMQTGSDGRMACGSCHFHAGADGRVKNTVRPLGGSYGAGLAPNHTLTAADFPFHQLADLDDARSQVLRDHPNRVTSQGVALHAFVDIVPGQAEERGTVQVDPLFQVNGVAVRRVAAINAPSNINAVFNHRQITVGAAYETFNGVNEFGERDQNARVLQWIRGQLTPVAVRIDHASLASQAVDPPLNASEMSYAGRTFPKLGKKLLSLVPLGKQQVHPEDSVLGALRSASGRGLSTDYASLIRAAFSPEFWAAPEIVTYDASGAPTVRPAPERPLTTSEFTQMEANFSLFWGLAIQLYESTLVSDDSRFDRVRAGLGQFTPAEEEGYRLFTGQPDRKGRSANCILCHFGAELSSASVENVERQGRVERVAMASGAPSLADTGFRGIGARRFTDAAALGTVLPGVGPLSFTRWALQRGDTSFDGLALQPGERSDLIDAAYKVPNLRNIELTGPYLHNGGLVTLRQVVDFYNRGSDFADFNRDHIDPHIVPLGLDEEERAELVTFLLTLTDERVRHKRAPFDHPQILVPHGHVGDEHGVVDDGTGVAVDEFLEVPAVGRGGGAPVRPYLDADPEAPVP